MRIKRYERVKFYERAFLNRHDSGGVAFVESNVEEPDEKKMFDATFKIGDCNRIVELQFGFYNSADPEEVSQLRYKLRKFKSLVNNFVTVVNNHLDTIEGK